MIARGLDASAAAAWAIGRAVFYAGLIPVPFHARALGPHRVVIRFDVREYLRAVREIDRAEARAVARRDAQIAQYVRSLAE